MKAVGTLHTKNAQGHSWCRKQPAGIVTPAADRGQANICSAKLLCVACTQQSDYR